MADSSNALNDNFDIDEGAIKEKISRDTLFPNPYASDILFASDFDAEDEDEEDEDEFDEDEEDLFDEDDLEEEGYEEDFDFDEEEDDSEEEDLSSYN